MDLGQITLNPKSMKAFRKNEEICKKLNEKHEDDVFSDISASGGGQLNLLGASDESSDGSEVRYYNNFFRYT